MRQPDPPPTRLGSLSRVGLPSGRTHALAVKMADAPPRRSARESSRASEPSWSGSVAVGMRVKVMGKECAGTVRFVGATDFKEGTWVGAPLRHHVAALQALMRLPDTSRACALALPIYPAVY